MGVFDFIFMVVLVGCSIPLYAMWSSHRLKRLTLQQNDSDLSLAVHALRDRVAVLEEIVTDGRSHLSDTIERLSNQPGAALGPRDEEEEQLEAEIEAALEGKPSGPH